MLCKNDDVIIRTGPVRVWFIPSPYSPAAGRWPAWDPGRPQVGRLYTIEAQVRKKRGHSQEKERARARKRKRHESGKGRKSETTKGTSQQKARRSGKIKARVRKKLASQERNARQENDRESEYMAAKQMCGMKRQRQSQVQKTYVNTPSKKYKDMTAGKPGTDLC